jgi:hypothetical protein
MKMRVNIALEKLGKVLDALYMSGVLLEEEEEVLLFVEQVLMEILSEL